MDHVLVSSWHLVDPLLCSEENAHPAPTACCRRFVMETICVAAFSVDFVVRAATCPSFGDFKADIMNWVDFVAIVPYYVTLVFNLLDLDPGLVHPPQSPLCYAAVQL